MHVHECGTPAPLIALLMKAHIEALFYVGAVAADCAFPTELSSFAVQRHRSVGINFREKATEWWLGTAAEGGPLGRDFRHAFAASFAGHIRVVEGGSYRFSTRSDDGSWLSIDGRLVVKNSGCHGAVEVHSDVLTLDAGLS